MDGIQKSSNTNWSLIGPQQAAVMGCPSGCRFSAQYSCHGGGCRKIQPLVRKMFWITLSTSVVQWLAMGWTTEVYFSEGQEIVCWHSWVHNSSGAHQPAVKWMPWGYSSHGVKFTIYFSAGLIFRMCVELYLHFPMCHLGMLLHYAQRRVYLLLMYAPNQFVF
jgi:hypothetical protein